MRLIRGESSIGFLTNITYEGLLPGEKMNGRKFAVIVGLDEEEDIIYLTLRDHYNLAQTNHGSGCKSEPLLYISDLPEFAIHQSCFEGTYSGGVEPIVMKAIRKLLTDISTLKMIYSDGYVEFWLWVEAKEFTAKFLLRKDNLGEELNDWFTLIDK